MKQVFDGEEQEGIVTKQGDISVRKVQVKREAIASSGGENIKDFPSSLRDVKHRLSHDVNIFIIQ